MKSWGYMKCNCVKNLSILLKSELRCLFESLTSTRRLRSIWLPPSLHPSWASDAHSNAGISSNKYRRRMETFSAIRIFAFLKFLLVYIFLIILILCCKGMARFSYYNTYRSLRFGNCRLSWNRKIWIFLDFV